MIKFCVIKRSIGLKFPWEFIPVGAYIHTEHYWRNMVRCGGLLLLLTSFVIALNIKQTDSSKQDHQLKKLIEDNKERLIEVFSELFSEGEGEGKLILVCFGINSSPKNYKIL